MLSVQVNRCRLKLKMSKDAKANIDVLSNGWLPSDGRLQCGGLSRLQQDALYLVCESIILESTVSVYTLWC